MTHDIVFHVAAAVTYGLLAIILSLRLIFTDQQSLHNTATRLILLGAGVLHGTALYQAILAPEHLFIGWALALSVAIWLGVVIFWIESFLFRIEGLLLLILPTAFLICLLAAFFPQGRIVHHAQDVWLRLHLLIAMAAYALITIAALHALWMAQQDRRLHYPLDRTAKYNVLSRFFNYFQDSQPSLLDQEHLLFQVIWIGFILLSLAVGSGAFTSFKLTGKVLPLDHKTVFTLLSWCTFGGLLLGRYAWGWRGKLALRWTLTGFGFLLLAYTGSRFVLQIILQRP